MQKSTVRTLKFTQVLKGQVISVPCEGGFIGKETEEDGVLFEIEGQDSVFVPESMIDDAMAVIKHGRKARTK